MPVRKLEVPDISAKFRSAREGVQHAVDLIESMLSKPRFASPRGETKACLEMRRDLPYVIHHTAVSGTAILVNRNYKPLGHPGESGKDWVKYEEATNMHVRLSLRQIASVVSPGRERGLFGDDNPPWSGRKEAEAYLQRLERLLSFL